MGSQRINCFPFVRGYLRCPRQSDREGKPHRNINPSGETPLCPPAQEGCTVTARCLAAGWGGTMLRVQCLLLTGQPSSSDSGWISLGDREPLRVSVSTATAVPFMGPPWRGEDSGRLSPTEVLCPSGSLMLLCCDCPLVGLS